MVLSLLQKYFSLSHKRLFFNISMQVIDLLCKHLTWEKLRIPVIRAGFPYHKDPLLYHWLWVFTMLPFLDEDSLNDLSEKHRKPNDKNSLFKPVSILSEQMYLSAFRCRELY
jgi:hypothetical protein